MRLTLSGTQNLPASFPQSRKKKPEPAGCSPAGVWPGERAAAPLNEEEAPFLGRRQHVR